MFEFLFKYPVSLFSKGHLVFLSNWPVWLMILLIVVGAAALSLPFWRAGSHSRVPVARRAVLWSLQAGFLGILLLILWQPALSVSVLRLHQNIVAVVVDDSRSMSESDWGVSRKDAAARLLDSTLLSQLNERFQVRLFRMSPAIDRIQGTSQLSAKGGSTRIGEALRQIGDEAASLPVGAVVLLSDGADNEGGLSLDDINAVRKQHIPVHTIGFGRERLEHDIEVTAVDLPARALAGSRVPVQVGLRQSGYSGRSVRLRAMNGSTVLSSRDVALKSDRGVQTEPMVINVGAAGARAIRIEAEPLGGEENTRNNTVNRLITVESNKPRILYVEGEPRWEYKFIRRAAELDQNLELVSMLRTTQNKVYRQGIASESELSDGFPVKVEDLFAYQGLIIGGVEAGYFTPAQLELIRQFADRRGGGVLFLGGRFGLADGGWKGSAAADMLPVTLPDRKETFRRDPANVELTAAGRDSLLCRIDEDPSRNADRWKRLPYLMNYQDPGTPRAGAVVLADMLPSSGGRMPLLVTQNYGRGRTAVFATAGSWRWQMQLPLGDTSHEMFWQQMLRWLVAGTEGRVLLSTDRSVYTDRNRVRLTTIVRDASYLPASDAAVTAHIIGPNGLSENVDLAPEPGAQGKYAAEFTADAQGSYIAEVSARRGSEETGRDALSFQREDGIAENFHVEQNRELLEKLSEQTGGRYYTPSSASRLPQEIAYSEAGISTRETRDLWNMPLLFLLALLMRSTEWMLRRRWGAV